MMRKSSLLTAKLAATTFFPGIVRKGGPCAWRRADVALIPVGVPHFPRLSLRAPLNKI